MSHTTGGKERASSKDSKALSRDDLNGATVVITGGTNGIGAALALRLRQRGARVIIIGRSASKADALVARAAEIRGPGSLEAIVADFSRMANVEATVAQLADRIQAIDYLIHGVGIFITSAQHTSEGIEKDFAVSYLSRFVFLEAAARRGLLTSNTRMINVAASSPKTPGFMQMEFDDMKAIKGRVGFKGHAQAQLANDLLTAQAGARYGIAAMGYGPGNLDTGILRELPWHFRLLFAPVLAFTRRPLDEAADQLIELLTDANWRPGQASFAHSKGRFPIASFVANTKRQADLLSASLALASEALGRAPLRTPEAA